MNYAYSLPELSQIFQGSLKNDNGCQLTTLAIDSRKIQPGGLFFCIAGENTDGHLYIQQAVDNGAACLVADETRLPMALETLQVPLILVADPNQALMDLAKDYRSRFQGTVLGITGSAGKTSTKELAGVLCTRMGLLAHINQGSFNNFVGVPLTILGATLQEAWWVSEMGTNHFGEISTLSNLVRPTCSMITCIGESHLEFLKNTEGVAQEKSGIFDGMAQNSVCVVPAHLKHLDIVQQAASRKGIELIRFGFKHNQLSSQYEATLKEFSANGAYFDFMGKEFHTPLGNPVLLESLLGLITIFHHHGIPLNDLQNAVRQLSVNVKGRMHFRQMASCLLVDDTYNANPTSFQAVIAAIRQIYPKRRLLVVAGSMAELGETSKASHRQVGQFMKSSNVSYLFAFGNNDAQYYVDGWKNDDPPKQWFHTDDWEQLVTHFQTIVQPDDVVLVKGSRASKMEQFIAFLE